MTSPNSPDTITIDGPAGAGKSTLGALLAQRLGYLYFDTGIMYRALTWAALRRQLDLSDADALAGLAQDLAIDIAPPTQDDGRQFTVLIDNTDATWELRSASVEKSVSQVARHPAVRTIMRARQRAIGMRGQVVMVGRDIGTIVLPEARLKVYLEASLHARAARRAAELQARGLAADTGAIEADVARRDALDQHVMGRSPDALVLNNDDLSPEAEVDAIVAQLRAQG
ncbi:cytidylate kinase [Kouleothrix aurantiaca]|jgi:cytidylate kinase|uniref:Cytidylate kinase n=1 Tax=Kouleothrix aurantiaca TaxID=186479 RepID=A0A0P9DK28_9CHLR|nr:cytidylate kinase [Kouleothrix aurantiaca]